MNTPVKYSHQREAILTFLKTRTDHPTADVVYNHIKETIPTISLGTVYRNLNQLANAGVILRLSCDGKTDRFDADTHPHCHFMCLSCGSVSDIMMDPTKNLIENATPLTNHQIETAVVMFQGTCNNCIS
ncbi:MAG: transcriptional repressor [Eubacteriales bacterium]|nr:transcriptional repressor [Lachnospiraceae bacterium]MDO5127160.1 transcriptional repressor [Eubacteriales bacterium]